jgi:N-methylhydantoinase B
LDPKDAEALEVSPDDLVEMYGRNPAPLRAWVRIAPGKPGEIPMDDFGRRVLGVKEGDSILVRFVPTPVVERGYA